MISVIVPVYRVEKYLPQCVQSILGQTCPAWELILVDDGSPDRCGEICEQFARQDGRIRVLHKENGGLADARNAGTAVAQGEYITYIDSDDWVAPQLLERLLEQAKITGADVVVCDMAKTDSEEMTFENTNAGPKTFTGPQAMETMLYQTGFDTSACGKLFHTELCKKNLFPKGHLYEDLFTIYKMLFAAQTVVYLPQVLYAYRKNPDSIMYRKFDRRNLDELDAADAIEAFVQENCPQFLPAARARKFSSYSQVLRWMKDAESDDAAIKDEQYRIWAFLKEYRVRMLMDRRARTKNRIAAIASFLGMKFYQQV